MKVNRTIEPLVLALALSVGALGCKSTAPVVTKLPGSSGTAGSSSGLGPGAGTTGDNAPGSGPSSSDTTGIAASTVSHTGWPEDREALAAQTVHFEYDSTAIKANDKAKVQAVADYLKSNPANAVRIEGHCDERGTDEYNRALGERRAGAIREQLVHMGVDPNRIDTISFGRDKPVDTGHSEAAHAKNRRGEFVVLTPPK
jgi:peptidoglycan-associated lipoprotein